MHTIVSFCTAYINFVDNLSQKVGKATSWLATVLVLLIVWDVAARYWFSYTSVGMVEAEWHLFAVIFLMSTAYALQKDKHVRVDVWYGHQSPKVQALINIIGGVFFLVPLCVVCIWYGTIYAYNAWLFNESSPDAGGLPYRFIIKSITPIGISLLLLQGISQILKAVLIFVKK